MLNPEEHLTPMNIEIKQAGVSADQQEASIPQEDWYYAQVAIGNIKPMTTILTPGKTPSITKRQVSTQAAASSEFVEVLRYVTGRSTINWPPVSENFWIVGGVEKETPRGLNSAKAHYLNYHDIWNATAYTDAALKDTHYESAEWPNYLSKYASYNVGQFSKEQTLLYPLLEALNAQITQGKTPEYVATNAPILPPEQLIYSESGVINRSYPEKYISFVEQEEEESYHGRTPSVISKIRWRPSIKDRTSPEQTPLYSTAERGEGADFLEVDLGGVQGVNYLSFEATNKPFEFNVAYDLLDAYPERRFKQVTYNKLIASTLDIGHEPQTPNPWRVVEMFFTNSLGRMIYTRFVRIECKRRTGAGSPFTLENGTKLPFSLEIRNLRVGRLIS